MPNLFYRFMGSNARNFGISIQLNIYRITYWNSIGNSYGKKADGRKNNKAYFRFYANDARFCILNSICYFFRIR